jgi:hypothetical protein
MIALPGALTGLPEYRNGGLFVDRVAEAVRARLGKSPAELRPGGGPPIRIESDGTVF